MTIELLALPYEQNALEPHISAETIEYHYGENQKSYVEKLNNLTSSNEIKGKSLEEIVKNSTGAIFNNAAQVWNHNFYWSCLSPLGGGATKGELADAITKQFDSLEAFKKAFSLSAVGNFGSGWTWLVKNITNYELEIINTHNAHTPLTYENTLPLLTIDVWEHAYYIDYRNARAKYIDGYWKLVNLDFVGKNYSA
ncbi:superoxide dismutase [Zhongshania sp.]|jgi:Fe-Mn family superoxide dismutase|uniref:superoxide dismutase n=1 Tax=Zhongshania sp. TaxID=1971902 RepID=UPI002A836EE2|nr:Fe-Mn family superoxide dismutase [Zhongshania sp.]